MDSLCMHYISNLSIKIHAMFHIYVSLAHRYIMHPLKNINIYISLYYLA